MHVHLGKLSKYCKIKIIHRCGEIVNDLKSETLTNKKFISNRMVYVIVIMNNMQIVKKKIFLRKMTTVFYGNKRDIKNNCSNTVMTEFTLHMGINSSVQMF